LQEIIEKHGAPEIFITDQGSQYTSGIHAQMLLKNGIRISMEVKGPAIGNIFIERFWRTVKYENIDLQSYKDGISRCKELKIYFKFFNTQRFYQSLDYA
jgi:putative transposase